MNQEMLALTKELVGIPSVNSTPGEKEIGLYIEDYIRKIPYFEQHPELVFVSPLKGDALGRRNVMALLIGEAEQSAKTIIWHGHTDTVGVEDFASLESLAFSPDGLAKALAGIPLAHQVQKDLESGQYLFGRGSCDMKSGDAVFLVLLKEYASQVQNLKGNILVSFNPVEENSHTGMIEALETFAQLRISHGLKYLIAINNDYTCPLYPEDPNHYIYTGVGGKLLPCFYIQGKETHVGQCFEGLDPALLAANIAAEIEYNPKYSNGAYGEPSIPPTVLKLQDLKEWYNVQTAASAFLYMNYFVHQGSVDEILEGLRQGVLDSYHKTMALKISRYEEYQRKSQLIPKGEDPTADAVFRCMLYQELLSEALVVDPEITGILKQMTKGRLEKGMDKRQVALELVRYLVNRLGYKDPLVVIFLATPYCPYHTLEDAFLEEKLAKVVGEVQDSAHISLKMLHYFPSLSDSSYLRIGDSVESIQSLKKNFPQQEQLYPLPFELIRELDIPAVNYGVYGKDAHKWTERVDIEYSFGVLPELIRKTVSELLA